MEISSIFFVRRLHFQLLQLDNMHPVRPVGGLSRARVGNRLVHSAYQLEHDVVLLEREFLFDFDALDQFL